MLLKRWIFRNRYQQIGGSRTVVSSIFSLLEEAWFNRYVHVAYRSSSPVPSLVPRRSEGGYFYTQHRNHGNTSNELLLDASLIICLHVDLSVHALEACSVYNFLCIINLLANTNKQYCVDNYLHVTFTCITARIETKCDVEVSVGAGSSSDEKTSETTVECR